MKAVNTLKFMHEILQLWLLAMTNHMAANLPSEVSL